MTVSNIRCPVTFTVPTAANGIWQVTPDYPSSDLTRSFTAIALVVGRKHSGVVSEETRVLEEGMHAMQKASPSASGNLDIERLYAERLTTAVQARLAALDLPTPVTVNITLAPEGARSSADVDDHAPVTYPRNAIEAAIDDAITHTPTPSALPGTSLDRLGAAQP